MPGLGHQQAIERVPAVQGQRTHPETVFDGDRELFASMFTVTDITPADQG